MLIVSTVFVDTNEHVYLQGAICTSAIAATHLRHVLRVHCHVVLPGACIPQPIMAFVKRSAALTTALGDIQKICPSLASFLDKTGVSEVTKKCFSCPCRTRRRGRCPC